MARRPHFREQFGHEAVNDTVEIVGARLATVLDELKRNVELLLEFTIRCLDFEDVRFVESVRLRWRDRNAELEGVQVSLGQNDVSVTHRSLDCVFVPCAAAWQLGFP